jgi:hypothetical protein
MPAKPKMIQVINRPGGGSTSIGGGGSNIKQASQQQRNRNYAIQSVISSVNNANNAIAVNMSGVNMGMINNFVGHRQLPVQQQ